MNVYGDPGQWSGWLDSMVPRILRLTIAAWESMTAIAQDEKENDITLKLCVALRKNRGGEESTAADTHATSGGSWGRGGGGSA